LGTSNPSICLKFAHALADPGKFTLQPHEAYITRQHRAPVGEEKPAPAGMCHRVGPVILRCRDTRDLDALYTQKNDPEVANLLGGFATGYSRRDIECWLEAHRTRRDEAIWVIADPETDACLGHVGLYNIDGRVRSCE